MHPAYSVVLFTTASGGGYGLLIWLALLGGTGFVPVTGWTGFFGLGLSLALITVGLLSSTAHLGRPERAWRAVSQWRSSWLSREGVLAILTYMPAGVLGIGWVFLGDASGLFAIAAALTVFLALMTVWCTGMIYASLPTIRAWHQPIVAPIYIALALATGAILLNLLLLAFGHSTQLTAWIAVAASLAAFGLKARYWTIIDTAEQTYTTEAATGLRQLGKVRPLQPAHSQPNYVMREMGYSIARKHAEKLRRIAMLSLFVLPTLLSLLLSISNGTVSLVLAALAAGSAIVGVAVERWLFFAEAKHVVMLYYGAAKA